MSSVAAGAGISLGTIALVGGVIAVAGIAYLIYKNNDDKLKATSKPLKKLIDDEDKYKGYKIMIETAIQEKNWQTLEELIDSRVKKYPDLINMINEALKEKK